MKKDIRDVRKNIAERKKRKVRDNGSLPFSKVTPPQDEEMHGFPPLVTGNSDRSNPPSTNQKRTSYVGLQIILALILFGIVAVSEKTTLSFLDKPERWLTSQMQEDFPFASVTAWYSDKFGDPLQVVQPKEKSDVGDLAMPVNGTVTTPFQSDGKGIIMTTENNSQVKSVREGTVIFAGKDSETENTVILQHKDGSKSIYGYLSDIDVYLYEHIQAHTSVGSVQSEEGNNNAKFFFAIEKDKQYLDPVEVIKVDESS